MHSATNISEVRRFDGAPRATLAAGVVGAAGVVVAAAFGWHDGGSVFFRAYILNYCFVLSIALGALFFVMLQHLTRAGWSVALRRLAELIAGTLPVLTVLFVPILIPIVLGMKGVYEWADPAVVAGDALLQGKQAYLNVPFFVLRIVVCFGVWVLLARFFLRQSAAQDADGALEHTERMQWWSAPGMLLYAVTVTCFSIDVLMSLNPHWFSTIWGVYFFSGCVLGFFSLLAVVVYLLQGGGRLTRSITLEHYHDVGKFAFAFVVFWAYIAFSQYMLIWYGNIPEETVWYRPRQGDDWWIGVSILLLMGHFVAPFLALLSRYPKRRKGLLVAAAVWLLLMHWLDLYYIVAPRAHGAEGEAAHLAVSDVALLVGLGGLFAWALLRQLGRYTLLPERDPRLGESLTFENV